MLFSLHIYIYLITESHPRPSRPWNDQPGYNQKPQGPYLSQTDRKYWDDLYRNGPQAYYDKYGNPLPGIIVFGYTVDFSKPVFSVKDEIVHYSSMLTHCSELNTNTYLNLYKRKGMIRLKLC